MCTSSVDVQDHKDATSVRKRHYAMNVECVSPIQQRTKRTCSQVSQTSHLPFSPCIQIDDNVVNLLQCSDLFVGKEVIITEKLDGGNCQLYQGRVYARTCKNEATHQSFSGIKSIYAQIKYLIPNNLALFGENMLGIHSIEYNNLKSFFYLFSILEGGTRWLGWDEIVDIAEEIGVPHVPLLFRGTFNSSEEIQFWMDEHITKNSQVGSNTGPEGFVIRTVDGCDVNDFEGSIAKYVRKNHVQTGVDWKRTWKAAKIK
ncbi:hypothetical protein AKO1_008483 [Acrasis kona]|uniref:RNA ligase domain-containing protein n=1 Tax=Acrasis kona TaxID=1008807 RepID=A0AAW2YN10_9EUKA